MERTITVPAEQRKTVKYGQYEIQPRQETGWYPPEDNLGWWVTKGGVNIMPGACWFHSVREAIDGIEKLEIAKGNANLFWLLMGNGGGLRIEQSVDDNKFNVTTEACTSASTAGRKGNAKMTLRFKKLKLELTPADALAIAAILTECAELTLGRD
jgi:hypothetical protein